MKPSYTKLPSNPRDRYGRLLLLLLLSTKLATAESPGTPRLRIKELSQHFGETVTVKGRTGQIMEQYESEGFHAFSLRDDFGDMVVVLTNQEYPIMGTTVHVTGTPEKRGKVLLLRGTYERWPRVFAAQLSGHVGDLVQLRGKVVEAQKQGASATVVIEDETGRATILWSEAPRKGTVVVAYGKVDSGLSGEPVLGAESVQVVVQPSEGRLDPRALAGVLVGLAVVLGAGFLWLRRRIQEAREAAESAALPPPWGIAEVIAGPDQGKSFALRYEEVHVGREVDPLTEVALTDLSVSRRHGRILWDRQQILYQDTDSRGGSFVNEEQVAPGQQVALSEGAILRLGPTTCIRIRRADIPSETILSNGTGLPQGDERPTAGPRSQGQ